MQYNDQQPQPEPQDERSNMAMSSNQQYIMNTSFMLMRLNTSPLVEDIKNFLQSKEKIIKQDKEGEFYEEEKQIGLPLANPEGIMRICNLVRMRVNHHIVQGNFKEDHYWNFVSRARREITETIVKKCYDWDIDDSNLNMVIDEICALIEGFLTRTINNEERKSYGQQMQAREVITQEQRRGALASFASGFRR
jgi:hypothetical protein